MGGRHFGGQAGLTLPGKRPNLTGFGLFFSEGIAVGVDDRLGACRLLELPLYLAHGALHHVFKPAAWGEGRYKVVLPYLPPFLCVCPSVLITNERAQVLMKNRKIFEKFFLWQKPLSYPWYTGNTIEAFSLHVTRSYTSWTIAISAASPRRGPMRTTRV